MQWEQNELPAIAKLFIFTYSKYFIKEMAHNVCYDKMPNNTQQILHNGKYHERKNKEKSQVSYNENEIDEKK